MNPNQNTKFEAALQQLRDKLEADQSEVKELTEEEALEGWRIFEKGNILRDQKVLDFARDNPEVPKQMVSATRQVELIKQKDHFFNETGFEVHDLLVAVDKLQLKESDELKAISAKEYKHHAEKFQAKTESLMGKIALIENALKLEEAKKALAEAQSLVKKAGREDEKKESEKDQTVAFEPEEKKKEQDSSQTKADDLTLT